MRDVSLGDTDDRLDGALCGFALTWGKIDRAAIKVGRGRIVNVGFLDQTRVSFEMCMQRKMMPQRSNTQSAQKEIREDGSGPLS